VPGPSELTPAKRALLERLQRERQEEAAPIPRLPDGEERPLRAPLSLAQERFWLLEQLEPGSPAHRIPSAVRLRGALDLRALRRALSSLVERHESLRTTLELASGGPVQVIHEAAEVDLPLEDFWDLSESERARRREQARDAVVLDPIDLVRGPTVRFRCLRLAPDDHELLICLHHAVADGLSTRVLGRELAHLYTCSVEGREPALPALAIRPRDFAVWQRARAQSITTKADLAAWRDRLAGAPEEELPADHPPAPTWRRRGGRVARKVESHIVGALHAVSRSENATPAMALLALLAAALTKWTGAADRVLGVPVANRTRPELTPLIGFFVNSLPARIALEGKPSFRESLRRARAAAVDAQSRQDVPFEKIVEAVAGKRRLDRSPLFQVMCNYIDFVGEPLSMPALETEVDVLQAGTLHDLTLYGWARDQTLTLELEYDSDRFEAPTMERLVSRIAEMARRAATSPDAPWDDWTALPDEEMAALARLGTGPPAPALQGTVLDDLARRASAEPDALAVRDGSRSITVRQLHDSALAVTAALRAEGVQPGDLVGLCVSRSVDLLPLFLGILGAGAAAVPLDPRHPGARRRRILDAARPTIVLVDSIRGDHERELEAQRCLRMRADGRAHGAQLDAPAYVIFTSGSTGAPKGVVISHRSLSVLLHGLTAELGVKPGETWAAVTTITFDIALLELLGPIVSGGVVRLASEEEAADGRRLRELLERERPATLQATPTTWRMLLDAGWRGTAALRMLSGGEALAPDLAEALLPFGGELWNLYGPTETTIWSTAARLVPGAAAHRPPVGVPLPGTSVEVVDRDLRLIPFGSEGELLISGAGVALRYLNDPQKTAERFVVIPDRAAGAKHYRTGDRARWRFDGQLEILGRDDEQVKLRGHRLELGDVEAAAREHPAVAQAAAVVRGQGPEARLLLWIRPRDEEREPDVQSARDWGSVWESTYRSEPAAEDASRDWRGWRSALTGKPLGDAIMEEWAEATAARVLDGKPRRVLEIGCGSGIVLFRAAPFCELWEACDPSETAVARMEQELRHRGWSHARVRRAFAHEAADRFRPSAPFDRIVLNSVVQYFPSINYLREVLAALAPLLTEEGSIFLGDLRSLPLAARLHEDRLRAGGLSGDDLPMRAFAELREEPELLIDPRGLGTIAPPGLSVRHAVRRGRLHHELTRYRFDACIERRGIATQPQRVLAWGADVHSFEELERELRHGAGSSLAVTAIPNARIERDGIDPEDLWHLGERLRCNTTIQFGADAERGALDALLSADAMRLDLARAFEGPAANDPARGQRARRIALQIREHLKLRLPEYAVPSRIFAFDAVPTTPNGKTDRRALMETTAAPSARIARSPSTLREQQIAPLLEELLGLSALDAEGNFFELGGHSLLAARLLARVGALTGVDVPLRVFFENPTLAALAKSVDTIAATERVGAAEAERTRCLSDAQKRLWFLHRLDPSSPEYTMAGAAHLRGPLDTHALAAAFRDVVARHEVLRTRFVDIDGMPQFALHPQEAFELRHESAAGSTIDARRLAARERAQQIALEPFKLESDPLVRAVLLAIDRDEHFLLLSQHHAVSDGQSLQILLDDWSSAYRSRSAGAAPSWPALRRSYAQIASTGATADAAGVDFWKSELAGIPTALDLPLDHARPPFRSARGHRFAASLPAPLVRALRAQAKEQGATLFSILLASFEALLFRWTLQERFVVGSVLSGRRALEHERTVGPFIQPLPLVAEVSAEAPFHDHMQSVWKRVRTAIAHGDIPFERILEVAGIARDASRTPLFQCFFDLRESVAPRFELPRIAVEAMELDLGVAKMDLSLSAAERPDGALALEWEAAADLLDRSTIERLASAFEVLVESAVQDAGTPLSNLRLSRETPQFVADARIVAEPLVTQFARRARLEPKTAVVRDERGARTWEDLWSSATSFASHIRALGDGLVGVEAPIASSSIAAILGCWLANRPWVPVDPSWPERRCSGLRLQQILEPPEFSRARHLSFHHPEPSAPEASEPSAVYHTSGTTGAPKGVILTHRAHALHVKWFLERFAVRADDRFLLRTALGFDASLCEILPALAAGATICVADSNAEFDAERIAAQCARDGITLLQVAPALLQELTQAPSLARCRSLRAVLCGGEALSTATAQAFLRRAREGGLTLELHNLYGPTEACIDACVHRVLEEECASLPTGIVPIGKPLPHVRAQCVDDAGRELPMGFPGELWLSGESLALGYRDDPARTREVFVPHGAGQELSYRTGDRVRRRADGTFEFLGRADAQLKIRGVRLEAAEIEGALTELPEIVAAAVAAAPDGRGSLELAAFVVLRDSSELAVSSIQGALRATLPAAGIPTRFVTVPKLPVTSSGKIDRRALLASLEPQVATPAAPDPPATATERALADLWEQVLGAKVASRSATFFALGGHSLLAVRLLARVRAEFGRDLSLRALFESPSLESMARALEHAPVATASRPAATHTLAEIPPTPAQRRLWFLERLEPESSTFTMAAAFRVLGELDAAVLQEALLMLEERHDALRMRIVEREGLPILTVSSPGSLKMKYREALSEESELRRTLELFAAEPFSADSLSWTRVLLLRRSEQEHILCFAQSHMISDGRTVDLLTRELCDLYASLAAGRKPSLPAPAISYLEHAARLAAAPPDTEALHAWRADLAGLPPTLELPTDRPRAASPRRRGAQIPVHIPEPIARDLETRARQGGPTLFTLVLSAWVGLLHRWSGREDLAVGIVTAGRSSADTDHTFGPFINALPIRSRVEETTSLAELTSSLQQRMLFALEHAQIPLESIVEALGGRRDRSRPPIFQIGFDLASGGYAAPSIGGLRFEPIPLHTGTAKLALSLLLERDAQGITGALEYDSDLWDRGSMERLLARFELLLSQISEQPQTPLAAARLDAPGETLSLLTAPPPRTVPTTVLHAIAEQVRRTPDATAVLSSDGVLSYRTLWERARRISAGLRSAGVAAGDVVLVERPRSLETPALLLGVWLARAVWCPADPAWPAPRREAVVRAARPACTIGPGPLPDSAPQDDALPERSDLAYVIFTSGSTGAPKGVEVRHGALAAYVAGCIESLQITSGVRALLHTALTFDPSLLELCVPLASGGSVAIAPQRADRDPSALLAAAHEAECTLLIAVPSLLRLLVGEERFPKIPSLEILIAGGEPLPRTLARQVDSRLREGGSKAALWNLYGPTEAVIHALQHRFAPDARATGSTSGTVPIGTPIAGGCAAIVDFAGRPVPVGFPGELWLSGSALAQGYRARPEETRERFVNTSIFGASVRTAYRSGDRARQLPDGALEHLGRLDGQVKLRGVRMELREVEAALEAHPTIAAAAAALRGSADAPRLAAWVVLRDGVSFDEPAVRAHLRALLPDAYLPASIQPIAQLPRTSSQKLNRSALPEILPDDAEAPTTVTAPRTPLEERVRDCYSFVLERTFVDVHTSFFDLGGDSLRAVQLAARLSKELATAVPVAAVLDAPTVESLAAWIEAHKNSAAATAPSRATPAELEPLFQRRRATGSWPAAVAAPMREVFLTGATGSLGAQVLAELLTRDGVLVHCLIRAADPTEADQRLRGVLHKTGSTARAERAHAVLGSLDRPALGIDSAQYRTLADTVDSVVHVGASVDFLRSLDALAPANVGGTLEILELCRSGRPKQLTYISTLGVVAQCAPPDGVVLEDADPRSAAFLEGGYDQSKWIAERLVADAASRGLSVRTVRPARIVGHSESGAWSRDDLAVRIFLASLEMQAAPDLPGDLAAFAVDDAARAIVQIAADAASAPNVLHLVPPRAVTMRQIAAWCAELGYAMQLLDPHSWAERVRRAVDADRSHPMASLLPFLDTGADGSEPFLNTRLPRFDGTQARTFLDRRGLAPRPLDRDMLERFLMRFEREGWLRASRAPKE